jgi:cbb3-type cytochrome oxidase subunit 3
MFKEVLTHMDMSALSTAGLLLFVAVFVAVTLYALTRPPHQADHWARIPLTGEAAGGWVEKEEARP